ncbi:MAG: DUF134 domain-containing protein [Bacteroidota bacterium]|nr:DUF134 domain-containing protein [Bacteroidota bacterium]
MARTKKERLIERAPNFNGFKPFGVQNETKTKVLLYLEEYEAIKMCDYLLLSQAEAASRMNVSRPTVTRVYQSARRKIAKAMVEASIICIEGGHANIHTLWYKCPHCSIKFSILPEAPAMCPLCNSLEIEKID